MAITSLRLVGFGLMLALLCGLAVAADPARPDWVAREPLARVKKWFRWQDVTDPTAQKMLAEAADSIAAFGLEIGFAELTPKAGQPSAIAPGARERLREPPIVERNGRPQYYRWSGIPYAFTAIAPNRLAYLAYMADRGNPTRGYIEGFVFEKQADDRWLFVCHLSGYPQWHDTPKRVVRDPLGTRVPPEAKPEC